MQHDFGQFTGLQNNRDSVLLVALENGTESVINTKSDAVHEANHFHVEASVQEKFFLIDMGRLFWSASIRK